MRGISSSSKFVVVQQVLAVLQSEGFVEVKQLDVALSNEVVKFESRTLGKSVEFYKNDGIFKAQVFNF